MAKVALRGAKIQEKRNLRIQGRMQIFEKMSQKALNHDLRLALESRGKMLQIPLKIMDLGAFCVELRPFYCRKRILAPMSYISFWDFQKCIPYVAFC